MHLSFGSGYGLSGSESRNPSGAQTGGESTTNTSVLELKNPIVQGSVKLLLINVSVLSLLARVVE